MDAERKKRMAKVSTLTRVVFHWGFIPTVLYLGFKAGSDPGMPPLSILSLLWAWLNEISFQTFHVLHVFTSFLVT